MTIPSDAAGALADALVRGTDLVDAVRVHAGRLRQDVVERGLRVVQPGPGGAELPAAARAQMDDGQLVRTEAIINSMTPKERAFPEIIKGSRKRRIAEGCGLQVQDVNRLIKQQMQMKKMMKKMSKGGMAKMMRAMKGGGMPPGMGGPGGMGF